MTWKISKKLQLFCINIFMPSNLMTVPKSVSTDSVQGSGRWANRTPTANTGWTSVKSRLDPGECPPNIGSMSRLLQALNRMTRISVTQLKLWLLEALLWTTFRRDKRMGDLWSDMKTEAQKTVTVVAGHHVYQYLTCALRTPIQVIFIVFLQTWQ